MEDLQALCSSLVVMRIGRVLAAGPPQAFRDRFCAGYSLEIHLEYRGAEDADSDGPLAARITSLLAMHPLLQPASLLAMSLGSDEATLSGADSGAVAATAAAALRVATGIVEGLGGNESRLRNLQSALSPVGTGWALQAALVVAVRAAASGSSPSVNVFCDAAAAFSAWWRMEDQIDALIDRITAALPRATVADRSSGRLVRLSLPPGSYESIAAVFRLMRSLQTEAASRYVERTASRDSSLQLPAIASFGLSQNSLDVVLERMMDEAPKA